MTDSNQELSASQQDYKFSNQFAKHLEQVYFGGNWTASSLRTHIEDVTFNEATKKVAEFNTILALTYHIHYYVQAANGVLENGILEAGDKYSFDHPLITSEEEWQKFVERVFDEARKCVRLLRELPDSKWHQLFVDQKYGNYLRNILGTIEHAHYHLGQIVLLKKMIRS